ncbi:MAG: intracellular protease, PfpI family [Acidobacteriales bacterium]|nr:intracellular protease, PfpI family [Terriglobales bacterium]
MAELSGIRVAVLATNGFEEVELTKPRQALIDAGAEVKVISPVPGEIYGMHHHDKAGKVKVDLPLQQASQEEFDAVLLPGGALNADDLRDWREAQNFVRQADDAGKPIAVICHGGWLLVSANITKGRTMTSWPTIRYDIINSGANWEDREVLRDRNWVSSRKPDDIPAFNREMISVFSELGKQGRRAA